MSGGSSGGGYGTQHKWWWGGGYEEARRTEEAIPGMVTTMAVVPLNPEVMEVAMEAEVAWEEVTVVASINVVALGTRIPS